jgi:hypothetical protein
LILQPSTEPTMTLAFSVPPKSEVFPMRVIMGDQIYDFDAKVVEQKKSGKIQRFKLTVVGAITITSKRKRAKR